MTGQPVQSQENRPNPPVAHLQYSAGGVGEFLLSSLSCMPKEMLLAYNQSMSLELTFHPYVKYNQPDRFYVPYSFLIFFTFSTICCRKINVMKKPEERKIAKLLIWDYICIAGTQFYNGFFFSFGPHVTYLARNMVDDPPPALLCILFGNNSGRMMCLQVINNSVRLGNQRPSTDPLCV